MHSKAIEAGARALLGAGGNDIRPEDTVASYHLDMVSAAIAAYLAAMEAEGFSFVQTRQIEVVSGPPIYDPRPNVKG